MSDEEKAKPHLTERAQAAKRERETREAAALRANLRRRRAQGQAKGSAAGTDAPPDEKPPRADD